ncbi:transglutaminase domain protein [Methanolacinia petrolearia DSM 11571]|uniref:Transglutaminase domain protein n=1 Tax=Methanolacinia petrolearia (strain DSM 11571 / OCM 486 / SEBR 4847) TaxID=679926 RepID=E1RJQ6_METP4|nr:transglutaminase-like domain-containing protein [Methanolacinia petrolearia]ADN35703.1 transglutaminase domain protein [Methanolacinia petrolearia DSM 11571]
MVTSELIIGLAILIFVFVIAVAVLEWITESEGISFAGGIVVVFLVIYLAGGHGGGGVIDPVTTPMSSVQSAVTEIIKGSPTTTPAKALPGSLSPDAKKSKSISKAIDGSNSVVRSFSLNAISSKHGGKYNVQQVCDIYDKLYKSWTYVNDPAVSSDYYADAGESVRLLKGDCDDYAILMASCIQAIGGSPRIVSAHNGNSGHAYAELYLGDKKSEVDNLRKTISRRYGVKSVHCHTSSANGKKQYWLNLDWSANHPGGSFYKNSGEILIIYPNGKYYRENFNSN